MRQRGQPLLKYQQIKQRLESLMSAMSEGDRIPPERQLATDMDCSVLTVRSALGLLVDEGRITRCRGRGTFVGSGAPDMPPARKRQPEKNVGVLVHSSSDAYAIHLNQTLTNEAEQQGVILHPRMIGAIDTSSLPLIEALARQGCGAIVVPWVPTDDHGAVLECAQKSPIPLSLPVQIPGLERNLFETPEVYGTNAARHVDGLYGYFTRLGFRRIAFLGPDAPHASMVQRVVSEYVARATRAGAEMICGLVSPGPEGIDALAVRWSQGDTPVAVISFDDQHALRLMTAMHKLGLHAPHDYAIAGFNNSSFAAHTDPPLSSMYQDSSHAAHWLIRNALALASDRTDQATGPADLRFAVRQSCGGQEILGRKVVAVLRRLGIDVAALPEPGRKGVAANA